MEQPRADWPRGPPEARAYTGRPRADVVSRGGAGGYHWNISGSEILIWMNSCLFASFS
jgi:hypothetical protein